MEAALRWTFGGAIAILLIAIPTVHYRAQYAHAKRVREVAPGVLYRCGQLTQNGFAEVVKRYGIKTIINVQDEAPDPAVARSLYCRSKIAESALCQQLGIRYVFIAPELIPRRAVATRRPQSIDQFLAVMDDPKNHPVLLHCRAGLHRTGVLTSVYRMEYEGWTPEEAIRELKANGFGNFNCNSSNDYIVQYVLKFQPGLRGALISVGDQLQLGN